MSSRKQFQMWWEEFYGVSPREGWEVLYSYEHDSYSDEEIDRQYDSWKGSRELLQVKII